MPAKNSLKILSGKFKGLSLVSPRSTLTHPMGAREKLALFNMIQPYLEGAKVLDIYAGSGALGIEALSRGAKSVVFVEKTAKIAQIIRQNLHQIAERSHLEALPGVLPTESRGTAVDLRLDKNGKNGSFCPIFTESAMNFATDAAWKGQFEVILADPPYDRFDISEVAELPKLLQSGGILALSFPFANGTPEISGLKLLTAHRYAAAGIAIYQK